MMNNPGRPCLGTGSDTYFTQGGDIWREKALRPLLIVVVGILCDGGGGGGGGSQSAKRSTGQPDRGASHEPESLVFIVHLRGQGSSQRSASLQKFRGALG